MLRRVAIQGYPGCFHEEAARLFYGRSELLSIVENTALMGIPYPPALKNAIEVLQKQTGRKDDNDD